MVEGREDGRMAGRIRLGMVGGGEGAFIGAVHRMAARLDDHFELVAGALSATPEKSRRSGEVLGLDPGRIYDSFEAMAVGESRRADGIEAVAIVTPNHVHAPAAEAFLRAGIHVICDKPLTTTLGDALKLRGMARDSGLVFAVTHNYTGYPLVRTARELVATGELGKLRVVQVQYAQDWLTEKLEDTGQKQAAWRADPAQSGAGGALGDIGTHAFNLLGFVTGLQVEELCADLSAFVEGRKLDDNDHVLLRFAGGARGMLWVSQVAPGNENGLKIRVYGSKGGLEWAQEQPNALFFTRFGEPTRVITRGTSAAGPMAARVSRVPSGHPEGYIEAFATIYSEAAAAILAARNGTALDPAVTFPTVDDGVAGVAFIEAAVRSSAEGAAWVKLGGSAEP